MDEDYDNIPDADEEEFDPTGEPTDGIEDDGGILSDGDAAALDEEGPDEDDEIPTEDEADDDETLPDAPDGTDDE